MVISEEKSPDDAGRVWSKYGLKQSPYLTTPTRLVGTLPIDKVFCGRKEEVTKLKNIIRSSSSTGTLVMGDFGVGKTTFVNYVRWNLAIKNGNNSKYLTTNVEIKVQPDWDATKYLVSTLSAIYTSSIIFDWEGNGLNIPSLKKIEECVSITTQKNYQGGVAGFSAGYGEVKSTPQTFSPEILEYLLSSFCKDIMKLGREVVVSYDNFEDIKNPEQLADFFKSIRDYTQIEGLHSIFIGPPYINAAVEKYDQVHSVLSQPILLYPLNIEDVLSVLKKRCEVIKLEHGNYIQPYDEETITELYKKLNNNIRFTFKVLEDTTILMEAKPPCRVTMPEIIVVQEIEKKEIFSRLTKQQTRIVTALLGKDMLSQKELSDITSIAPTNLSNQIDTLEKKGLITAYKSDDDKRFKYIKISENSYLKLVFATEVVTEKTS